MSPAAQGTTVICVGCPKVCDGDVMAIWVALVEPALSCFGRLYRLVFLLASPLPQLMKVSFEVAMPDRLPFFMVQGFLGTVYENFESSRHNGCTECRVYRVQGLLEAPFSLRTTDVQDALWVSIPETLNPGFHFLFHYPHIIP